MLWLLRMVALLVVFVLGCLAGLLLCLVRPFHRDNSYWCARLFALARFPLGITYQQLNSPPLGASAQAVYVCNHQDSLDMFLYGPMLPKNIAFLGKHSLMYIPLFGQLFWLAGNVFINRADKRKAHTALVEAAENVQRKGCAVFVFPEGTRSRGQGLLPFKHGAFTLAIEAGLPVIPLVFSSTHRNIDLKRLHAGEVRMEYLPPVSVEGLNRKDARRLAAEVQVAMAQKLDELDQQLADRKPEVP